MCLFSARTGKKTEEKAYVQEEKGFTLLEVLVAVTILGLAYVAILQNFSVSMRSIVRLEDRRSALMKSSLEFAERLYAPEEEDGADDTLSAPSFLEGSKYRLVIVTDEGNNFMSLKLTRL